MVKASRGTLVKCDASIKAMLVDIDSKNNNEFIIEELDEEHLLVKETKINELKSRLNQVSIASQRIVVEVNMSQMMRERLKEPESSDTE
ncbi:transcription factor TFIIH complex subunit Tfb5-domain-containing protein [Pyrenochaeta sp. MPI-SDFR-AT-0127]|nr:transcription factor TFIIH complex subunit Tfb5-domain-containing protein [Pyrenochaeta sp. MPI-SDFR-AT-0127]